VSDPHDHRLGRRAFLRLSAGAFAAAVQSRGFAEGASETLYNGIRLARPWPPRYHGLPPSPITPPYLVDRPAVIPIDLGRQLFVDDFLIDEASWRVDYLVVDTSNWFGGKSVLVSPTAIANVDVEKQEIRVRLTRKEIEKSPSIDTADIQLIATLPPVLIL